MGDRSMFSDLINFGKNEELFNNGLIEIMTSDGIYYYEVFSVHIADPWFHYRKTVFLDEEGNHDSEEYIKWLYEMKSLSIFENERVEFTPESKIITLSTCTNTFINPRFAVHGILVGVNRYSN
jgi:hypothetical protein